MATGKFGGNVLTNAFGRESLPGLLVDFDALIEFVEEKVSIFPETVELVVFIDLVFAFVVDVETELSRGSGDELFQFPKIGFGLSGGDLDQHAILIGSHCCELFLRQIPDRPLHLIFAPTLVFARKLQGASVGSLI